MKKLSIFIILLSLFSCHKVTRKGKYYNVIKIKRSESYIDQKLNIVVAFVGMAKNGNCFVHISLPENEKPIFTKILVGDFIDYSKNNKKYRVVFSKINSKGKSLQITIMEQ